jgi:hypothetical protein
MVDAVCPKRQALTRAELKQPHPARAPKPALGNSDELKPESSSDCQRFQARLIFSQRHMRSRADITNQAGLK